ncbi:MAG: hypothetical protein ACR2JB_20150 [Bryobacteraceae bacterium]
MYLVLGKKILIDYLNNRTTIGSRAELEVLQGELLNAAMETDVLRIPTYRPPPPLEIANAIRLIAESTYIGAGRFLHLPASQTIAFHHSFDSLPFCFFLGSLCPTLVERIWDSTLWNGQHLFRGFPEPLERFRSFVHFRVRLHLPLL